jgi:hypothetical protein
MLKFNLNNLTYREWTATQLQTIRFKHGAYSQAANNNNGIVILNTPKPTKPHHADPAVDDETGETLEGVLKYPREAQVEGAGTPPMTAPALAQFTQDSKNYATMEERHYRDWTSGDKTDQACGAEIINMLDDSTLAILRITPGWDHVLRTRSPATTPTPCFTHDLIAFLTLQYSSPTFGNQLFDIKKLLDSGRAPGQSTGEALSVFQLLSKKALDGISHNGTISTALLAALLLFHFMNTEHASPSDIIAHRRILQWTPKKKTALDAKLQFITVTEMSKIYLDEDATSTSLDTPEPPFAALVASAPPAAPPLAKPSAPQAAPRPAPARVKRDYTTPDPTKPVNSHCSFCLETTKCYFYHADCNRKKSSARSAHANHAAAAHTDYTKTAGFSAAVASAVAASDAAHALQSAQYQQQINNQHSQSHDLLLALLGSASPSSPGSI